MPKKSDSQWADKKQEQLKEILQKLEDGTKALFESQRFTDYLKTMALFHNYSPNNILLILQQKPHATKVAGFKTWQKLNRHINKGEKGIQILAPMVFKETRAVDQRDPQTQKPLLDDNGEPLTETVEVVIPRFKVVNVFDISQTSGEPLPSLVTPLTGEQENFDEIMRCLAKVSPYPIHFDPLSNSTANGYCSHTKQLIVVKDSLSETQKIKTTIHEIAHAQLHAKNALPTAKGEEIKNTATKEVEAESVAFVVCHHFGIDTSNYTFGYLASWSSDKELKELRASLNTIQNQAQLLIDNIESAYKELTATQNIAAEAMAKPSLLPALATAKNRAAAQNQAQEKTKQPTKTKEEKER